ncbi:putative spermidine/putrescine transport system ATP-binding protein [Rhodobium orientis]|uniref:ABC transporter domain-containing protein n=1 Tax=Rhodobium orientis TaxID=34017 RepID=A0A327JKL9_9HYPH|nr:ABC transporter ATP-binding protein [Rhodobium orientis]MBB4303216.1 putative spermidine/putrescine transport system ATP-binding protein [Rhodobium orientis]MBK5951683.1 hypothetical protein [Rhodobium orientis]RAI25843.1 hypothetical protein CH339_16535 [Rhodobium orientis]
MKVNFEDVSDAGSAKQAAPILRLDGLSKHYGDVIAVEDLSLDVADGEFVSLLGPSGCGKTTTLRMVAGFIKPTAGRIGIAGKDVTALPPYKRDTGMVFQNYALFPHMTVAENVAFGLENLGVERSERMTRVHEMLRMVELDHLSDRRPAALSGGQQQRVALARALALQPALLLLDEPFSNLDAQLRVRLREDMTRIIERIGVTTLFVTHDQEEALALSDRIVVMSTGRVEQIGSPGEIYERPSSRFVADFIGQCTILDGTCADAAFRSVNGLRLPFEAPPWRLFAGAASRTCTGGRGGRS